MDYVVIIEITQKQSIPNGKGTFLFRLVIIRYALTPVDLNFFISHGNVVPRF
jgi:hypothetical protein